uniref:Uncharacterized protein n=1 Tax=Knipowitschia caucasica TaxID=637954 RepID=A0AAV2LQ97_KNICA
MQTQRDPNRTALVIEEASWTSTTATAPTVLLYFPHPTTIMATEQELRDLVQQLQQPPDLQSGDLTPYCASAVKNPAILLGSVIMRRFIPQARPQHVATTSALQEAGNFNPLVPIQQPYPSPQQKSVWTRVLGQRGTPGHSHLHRTEKKEVSLITKPWSRLHNGERWGWCAGQSQAYQFKLQIMPKVTAVTSLPPLSLSALGASQLMCLEREATFEIPLLPLLSPCSSPHLPLPPLISLPPPPSPFAPSSPSPHSPPSISPFPPPTSPPPHSPLSFISSLSSFSSLSFLSSLLPLLPLLSPPPPYLFLPSPPPPHSGISQALILCSARAWGCA